MEACGYLVRWDCPNHRIADLIYAMLTTGPNSQMPRVSNKEGVVEVWFGICTVENLRHLSWVMKNVKGLKASAKRYHDLHRQSIFGVEAKLIACLYMDGEMVERQIKPTLEKK